MKICVLERGWVLVGILEKDGDEYLLLKGNVIRRWGTTKGLGQLAIEGPTSETILDAIPLAKFNKNQLIFTLNCDESKWK